MPPDRLMNSTWAPVSSFSFNSQFKQDLCQHGIVSIGHRIAGQERMYAEMLCALVLQNLKCLQICSVVIPYLESPGLSMMSLLILNRPPGLKRQLMVSEYIPGSPPGTEYG